MFCKIDITGSNNLTRANNFYRGVHAVATAAAGSTPSVNNPSGGDIITSVISNTVAGGWTTSSLNNDSGTTSGATAVNNAVMAIKQPTGKPDTPYAHFCLMADSDESQMYAVFVYEVEAPTWDGAYPLRNTDWRNDAQERCWVTKSSTVSTPNGNYVLDTSSDKEIYVYAADGVIHIHHNTHGFIHWGTRSHMSWEDNYGDNPYYVALQVAPTGDQYGYWTDMMHHNYTNQTNSGPFKHQGYSGSPFNHSSASHAITGYSIQTSVDPMLMLSTDIERATGNLYFPSADPTGSAGAGTWAGATSTSSTYNMSGTPQYRLNQPIMNHTNFNGVTSDSTTGAYIPSASPIRIQSVYGWNNGGTMDHILQGAEFANEADIASYFTDGATYTIDGTDYVGLRWGAYSVLYVKKQ